MTHIPHRCARLLALLIVPVATIACHDAYDALFLDPDRSTTARIEYLFTQDLLDSDFPIHYGEWYWQGYDNFAARAQVSRTVNDRHMMPPLCGPWQNTLTDHYTKAPLGAPEDPGLHERPPAG